MSGTPVSIPRILLRLPRAAGLRCPHCGEGRLFRRPYRLHPACPVCGLRFERDEGDFWGGVVIGYTFGGIAGLAMTAALILAGVARWDVTIYAAALTAAATIVALYPFSKSLWIHLLYLTRGHYAEYRPPGVPPTRQD